MSTCLSRLKYFSSFSNLCNREISLNSFKHRFIHFEYNFLKQQMKSKAMSSFSRGIYSEIPEAKVEVKDIYDPDLNEFNKAYQHVRKAVTQSDVKAIDDAVSWTGKVLDYNTQGGKKNRGLTVVKAYKILSSGKLSSEEILQACLLGWCVEMLQGFFLVLDDIMDNSSTRRGKPCWYQKPDVGLKAINDALLLECNVYKILEVYFKKLDTYDRILHEFLTVTRNTVYGQTLDMLNTPPNQKPLFENFSLEKYCAIVEYKTSYYTFCLPVHLAMHLNGKFLFEDFEWTKKICLKLGLLFQIQDDYLDTFGDPNVTGKVGTDIVDGKCTWFSAWVLQHAPESMKQIMMENYGEHDPECISKVMRLYKDLCMEEKFRECEQELMKEICNLINTLSSESLQKLFSFLLQKLNNRKK